MLITVGGERDWRKFFNHGLVVLLDGVEQRDVVRVDDEAGVVVRYARDANGKAFIDGARWALEEVRGDVRFVGTRRFSPDDAKAAAAAKRSRRAARNLTIQNRAEVRQGGAA